MSLKRVQVGSNYCDTQKVLHGCYEWEIKRQPSESAHHQRALAENPFKNKSTDDENALNVSHDTKQHIWRCKQTFPATVTGLLDQLSNQPISEEVLGIHCVGSPMTYFEWYCTRS